ncbi:S8 family serine peptidase [Nocardioides aquiterrae]|uniref:Peptidase S8/S53 domain-containing protein n=1 Tax=Nocardioides aquiterrae TaxID=203799 RepID=A0ABN1UAE3_9ACTN
MPSSRTRLLALTSALVVALSLSAVTRAEATPEAPAAPAGVHAGLDRLLTEGTPDQRAIVRFDAVPTAAQVAALSALGLTVQPMRHLPLALVQGPVAAMTEVVARGIGLDVYPDERIQLLDTESSNAMSSSPAAAKALRAKGLTGKGVTVGVVDSGCDATHADLADRVVHNVKLYSPEYVNQGTQPTLVAPVDQGPVSNTDLGSGHGTHVAGIIAADSKSVDDGSRYGVAPDAELACFSIGEVLFTTAVVTAYDYILDQPDLLGIDVINNSWGNSYRQFDPNDPVAVATKAVADRGVTVVFAAGNSGSGDVPMSLNPFSQSPWVISVAAGTIDRHRGDFSSNGLVNDNSRPTAIGAEDHTSYAGDRIGLVHPDVTAPGVDISSTCDTAGTLVGPCPPNENTSASGTSMASPHIAGAAAVLLQAQPRLTPDQVRLALQATATPVKASAGKGSLPFWQVGYGFVNLDRAVDLVTGRGWAGDLAAAAAKADRRVRNADGVKVLRSDFFVHDAPPATAGGSDAVSYDLRVGGATRSVAVSLAFPSGGSVGASLTSYTVTVLDPTGATVATSTSDPAAGSGTALATFPVRKAGTYTFEVAGDYAASDPDTIDSDSALGRFVILHVAQLKKG